MAPPVCRKSKSMATECGSLTRCCLKSAKKNATGTLSTSAMRNSRPAEMRFMPRSYFCTCWKVTPSASLSSVWVRPRCSRRVRTRLAISASIGSRLRFPIQALLGIVELLSTAAAPPSVARAARSRKRWKTAQPNAASRFCLDEIRRRQNSHIPWNPIRNLVANARRNRLCLLGLHAGDLHRFRPQRDVGGNHPCEFLRSISEWVDTGADQTVRDARIFDATRHFLCDPINDRIRRSRWRHKTVPGQRLEPGKAGFNHRGNVRNLCRTPFARNREQPHCTSGPMRQHIGQGGKVGRDMTGDHIGQRCRTATFVRYGHHLEPGTLQEQLHRQMCETANTGGHIAELLRSRPDILHEFPDRFDRHARMHDQHERICSHDADW